MSAYVVLDDNDNSPRHICQDVMAIGRDTNNDVVLNDPHVSRRHAVICRLKENSFYLIDEGSANGSFLNASRIHLPTLLNSGDRISIGASTLRFNQPATSRRAISAKLDARATMSMVRETIEIVKTAVLVADIRGFTAISETMPVQPLTRVMNEWFRAATDCIREHRGIVDKFLGDCVYARWNASDDGIDAVCSALRAACELNRLSRKINDAHPELPQPLHIGAGVNFGIAAIGTDQGHTAIGDTINLTFRLQAKTRRLEKDLLIGNEALKLFPSSFWPGHPRRVKVKGKSQQVAVMGLSFGEVEGLLRGESSIRASALMD